MGYIWIKTPKKGSNFLFSRQPSTSTDNYCLLKTGLQRQRLGILAILIDYMTYERPRSLRASVCNLQKSISHFAILLTGPIFASAYLIIPNTME